LAADLDALVLDVLIECALRGDVAALRLAPGPIPDIEAHQFPDDDSTPKSVAASARRARAERERRTG